VEGKRIPVIVKLSIDTRGISTTLVILISLPSITTFLLPRTPLENIAKLLIVVKSNYELVKFMHIESPGSNMLGKRVTVRLDNVWTG